MKADQDLLKLVKTNALFKSVPESFTNSFIKPKKLFTAKEGTLLYSFEEEASELYLVVKGEVKIKFCDHRNIEYRHSLDFFGEKEILENSKRVSFAIANKDCKLYKIGLDELRVLTEFNSIDLNSLNKRIEFHAAESAVCN